MLLESVFETLRRIENERLQLPIFYESPIALRFETGDPSLDIFLDKTHLNPKYLRSAFWRVSFLYEKIAPFDTLLWVLYRTPDLETDVTAIIDRFCTLTHLPSPAEVYQQEVTTSDEEPMTRIFLLWDMKQTPPLIAPLLKGILSSRAFGSCPLPFSFSIPKDTSSFIPMMIGVQMSLRKKQKPSAFCMRTAKTGF